VLWLQRLRGCYGNTRSIGLSEAFAKTGIKYLQSERDRSAFYMDALPLFASGRVRLLDDKKLVSQFSSLERRVLSTGRERVEPGPGHDDLANSCAIALTLVGAETAPVLIRYQDFLMKDSAPYTGPVHHYHQGKSFAVDPTGKCAVISWRFHKVMTPQLILEDFDTGYFSEKRFAGDLHFLALCFNACGLRKVASVVIGDGCYPPGERDVIVDFGNAPLAARFVESGTVKIGHAAHDKSTLATLHDALDFRLDRLTDPLNAAAIAGVVKILHG
jgi:hypothetical protein